MHKLIMILHRYIIPHIAVVTWALTAILIFSSCKSTQINQELEHIYKEKSDSTISRRDSLSKSRVLIDSILVHDSIYVSVKNDTIREFRLHTEYMLREHHDTITLVERDTVYIKRAVEETNKDKKEIKVTKTKMPGWSYPFILLGILISIILAYRLMTRIKGRGQA